MPVRVGFTEYRRQLLQRELDRVVGMMPQLGVEKVFLIGSFAREQTGPDSNLNLVILHEAASDYKFGRREDFFSYHLDPQVATDFVVYTLGEFQVESQGNASLRYALGRGRVVYDAESPS